MVLQVRVAGQPVEVQRAAHRRVTAWQMSPVTAAAQSESVLQVQKLEVELPTLAHVLEEVGQSVAPVQLATHLASTGWQPDPTRQFASVVQRQLSQNSSHFSALVQLVLEGSQHDEPFSGPPVQVHAPLAHW